jgi:hypothetical protein
METATRPREKLYSAAAHQESEARYSMLEDAYKYIQKVMQDKVSTLHVGHLTTPQIDMTLTIDTQLLLVANTIARDIFKLKVFRMMDIPRPNPDFVFLFRVWMEKAIQEFEAEKR